MTPTPRDPSPGGADPAGGPPVASSILSDAGPIPLSPAEPHPSTAFSFLEPAHSAGEIGRLGQYRVLRLLGAGGMGFVFEAEDDQLSRAVALKVMKPEIARDRGFRERFLGEARAAARLVSDNVVTVYQVGCVADVPFLAMQLLHGDALQDRLRKLGPVTPYQALLVARETAAGLHAAHRVGLVHRDIKPANLWLETDPGGHLFRRLRVLDFGLARSYAEESHLTASGIIVGTPHYMSPEQASGHVLDGRADLFSLGCVIYTSLTGEMAFDGPSAIAILMSLATHTPPPLVERNPRVPRKLSDLVVRLMAKHRDGRPASAEALLAELEALRPLIPPDAEPFVVTRDGGKLDPKNPPSLPSLYPTGPYAAPASVAEPAPADTAPRSLFETPALAGVTDAPPPGSNRRGTLIAVALGVFTAALALTSLIGGRGGSVVPTNGGSGPAVAAAPIPVGLLFAASGPLAAADRPLIEAVTLAVEELNQAGGVLGRPLQLIEADDRSEAAGAAQGADKLLAGEPAAIFGGGDAERRRAARLPIERHNGLLLTPATGEGLERSPRIVYLGAAPNQRLAPLLELLSQGDGPKRLFLAGEESVESRVTHEIVRGEVLKRFAGRLVIADEFRLRPGAADAGNLVERLASAEAAAVLLTVSGPAHATLLTGLRHAGPPASDLPVFSTTLREADLSELPKGDVAGVTIVGTYFQAIDAPAGRDLRQKLRQKYGADKAFGDAADAAYLGVRLWARAAEVAKSVEPGAVLAALPGLAFPGLDGELRIDLESRYTWLPTRAAKVNNRGDAIPVGGTRELVRPEPYPPPKTPTEWERFRQGLVDQWGGRWQAPPKP